MKKQSVIVKGWASFVLCAILMSGRVTEKEAAPTAGADNGSPG